MFVESAMPSSDFCNMRRCSFSMLWMPQSANYVADDAFPEFWALVFLRISSRDQQSDQSGCSATCKRQTARQGVTTALRFMYEIRRIVHLQHASVPIRCSFHNLFLAVGALCPRRVLAAPFRSPPKRIKPWYHFWSCCWCRAIRRVETHKLV